LIDILSLADDLTGALEAGAMFARHGISAAVSFSVTSGTRALVIDTETRHLSPALAKEKISQCAVPDARRIYKKTDSTLRGNIGAELRALANAYAGARIAYVPAYPKLGRTVRDGCLHVDGVPVHQTQFARDALNPVPDCLIRRLLDDALPCDIFDGQTDADIDRAAEHILCDRRYRIVAGPAAIADSLARRLSIARVPAPVLPRVGSCLVVNGSRHEASIMQIKRAISNGWIGTADSARWRFLPAISGSAVRRVLRTQRYDAIMIFGGDTAFSIVEALGIPVLRPLGEVVPGVPCATAGDLTFITKAGGFGGPDVIRELQGVISE
jgi:uncharacterized protein YgbK (DUF1537 family)